MDQTFLAAAALTALSTVGYLVGVVAAYPGREASLVGLMVGIALAAVTYGREPSAPDDADATDGGDAPR